ncbi:Arc family DNA-binding protein [Rhizobium leguminosarum]|uniref:Arc family DNA-binding protein n=1 Tax=Rhizobium leguminosarum TaxID=384 RepID=UPI001031FAC2|nr:Arc family DNA-binding protein [Rhizobium leguminosarum]TBH09925.1 Arc family DNA-binding protein [Rhizobium leguminosarum]
MEWNKMGVNRSKTDQYQLRLPPGLREEIREAAELHARSMNAEIVERLEKYPLLVRLPMDISFLKNENERLAGELDATTEMLRDAQERAATFHRLNDQLAEKMEAIALQIQQRDEEISKLKSQLAATEGARDELRAGNFALQELIKKQQHDAPPIASDAPLTSELFDKLFSHLVRLEQKIDGKQET